MSNRKIKCNNSGARGLSKSKNIQDKSGIDEGNDSGSSIDLSCILKKKLKVFRVSPLYNFNYHSLKKFGIKISEELNAKKRPNSTTTYNCTFSLNDKLKLDLDYAEGVQVQVTDNQLKNIYLGYFISSTKAQLNSHGSVSLPILLVEAKGHEMHNIHSLICKLFDCDIQSVTFSFYALITFFVTLLNSSKESPDISQELLYLEYKIPCCKPKDRLKVTLFVESTTIVYAVTIDNLREKNKEIKDMDIILEFYNRILNHVYNIYELDLMFAELFKVSFPGAFITTDGQLKMSTGEVATTLLKSLDQFMSLEGIINT